jgi:hypothetical protein
MPERSCASFILKSSVTAACAGVIVNFPVSVFRYQCSGIRRPVSSRSGFSPVHSCQCRLFAANLGATMANQNGGARMATPTRQRQVGEADTATKERRPAILGVDL